MWWVCFWRQGRVAFFLGTLQRVRFRTHSRGVWNLPDLERVPGLTLSMSVWCVSYLPDNRVPKNYQEEGFIVLTRALKYDVGLHSVRGQTLCMCVKNQHDRVTKFWTPCRGKDIFVLQMVLGGSRLATCVRCSWYNPQILVVLFPFRRIVYGGEDRYDKTDTWHRCRREAKRWRIVGQAPRLGSSANRKLRCCRLLEPTVLGTKCVNLEWRCAQIVCVKGLPNFSFFCAASFFSPFSSVLRGMFLSFVFLRSRSNHLPLFSKTCSFDRVGILPHFTIPFVECV